jgi:hypothetical protein
MTGAFYRMINFIRADPHEGHSAPSLFTHVVYLARLVRRSPMLFPTETEHPGFPILDELVGFIINLVPGQQSKFQILTLQT